MLPRWNMISASALPKALCSAVPCGVASFVCNWSLHKHFEDWTGSDAGITIYSGFAACLGFMIVFRMNQAYSRWWEAGTLLLQARGQWFNAYSSLIALCSAVPQKAFQVLQFQHKLARLMSLLYGTSISQMCTFENPTVQTIHIDGFDEAHVRFLEECHDKVEVVLQWVQKEVVSADRDGTIEAAPPIISRIYSQLGNGMAVVTSARKMGEFPIPQPILYMISFMLCAHWLATVLISTVIIESSFLAAGMSFVSILCFWSINYVARELEMPFGDDPDDLPMEHLQADLNASLTGLLHPLALRPPSFELPISEEGSVHLQAGIMQLYNNGGSISFRAAGRSDSELPASSSGNVCCLSYSGKKSPDEHRHAAHRVHFHVPRILHGKLGKVRRGPTPSASDRRIQASRQQVHILRAHQSAVNVEGSQPRQLASDVEGCESSLHQQDHATCVSHLERTTTGHLEDRDNRLGKNPCPAESPMTPAEQYAI